MTATQAETSEFLLIQPEKTDVSISIVRCSSGRQTMFGHWPSPFPQIVSYLPRCTPQSLLIPLSLLPSLSFPIPFSPFCSSHCPPLPLILLLFNSAEERTARDMSSIKLTTALAPWTAHRICRVPSQPPSVPGVQHTSSSSRHAASRAVLAQQQLLSFVDEHMSVLKGRFLGHSVEHRPPS